MRLLLDRAAADGSASAGTGRYGDLPLLAGLSYAGRRLSGH